jgi:hypothetical protein
MSATNALIGRKPQIHLSYFSWTGLVYKGGLQLVPKYNRRWFSFAQLFAHMFRCSLRAESPF